MPADSVPLTHSPMFLRHGLLIELARLEIALRDARECANDHVALCSLQSRHAMISQALEKIIA